MRVEVWTNNIGAQLCQHLHQSQPVHKAKTQLVIQYQPYQHRQALLRCRARIPSHPSDTWIVTLCTGSVKNDCPILLANFKRTADMLVNVSLIFVTISLSFNYMCKTVPKSSIEGSSQTTHSEVAFGLNDSGGMSRGNCQQLGHGKRKHGQVVGIRLNGTVERRISPLSSSRSNTQGEIIQTTNRSQEFHPKIWQVSRFLSAYNLTKEAQREDLGKKSPNGGVRSGTWIVSQRGISQNCRVKADTVLAILINSFLCFFGILIEYIIYM